MKLYTQMIGGIGDILLAMMRPNSPLGYFQALKVRGDITMVVAHANCDAAADLLADLPYVDHLRFRGYMRKIDTAPGDEFQFFYRYYGLSWVQPRLSLDAEEQKLLDQLRSQPYVAAHVTASLPEKMPPDFALLLEGLRKSGLRVVLLGCETSDGGKADPGRRARGIEMMRGGFVVLPPKLRLHVAAVQHANKFIGTLSCFNCAAQLAKVPSFVLVNRSLQEPNVYRMMRENGAVIEAWNVGKPIEKIYRQAVEWALKTV